MKADPRGVLTGTHFIDGDLAARIMHARDQVEVPIRTFEQQLGLWGEQGHEASAPAGWRENSSRNTG